MQKVLQYREMLLEAALRDERLSTFDLVAASVIAIVVTTLLSAAVNGGL